MFHFILSEIQDYSNVEQDESLYVYPLIVVCMYIKVLYRKHCK